MLPCTHTHRLPNDLQKKGIVMHYHGGMSKDYLTQVYEDFIEPNGCCRILHATEGMSTVCIRYHIQFDG